MRDTRCDLPSFVIHAHSSTIALNLRMQWHGAWRATLCYSAWHTTAGNNPLLLRLQSIRLFLSEQPFAQKNQRAERTAILPCSYLKSLVLSPSNSNYLWVDEDALNDALHALFSQKTCWLAFLNCKQLTTFFITFLQSKMLFL